MEEHKAFLGVVNTEKQMLALIYSKGILHGEVLEIYRKIRTGYEKILLNSNQMVERQEIEYHLWKLHYKLIDEFRKRIRQRSFNAENMRNDTLSDNINSQSNTEKHLEGFMSFLSEASEFYRKLIVELRKKCGLPEEISFHNKDDSSFPIEPTKLHACQYTCHRLLICLGDIARYTEIVKKPDSCEWSTAATYYLEATRTWPDSGNPHNQLALLATYVGDAFLALYHCVRSLAIKEPFPDAWRNIMLLFEENKCTKLQSLSSQMKLDLLNPSKRSSFQDSPREENRSPNNNKLEDLENVCSEKSDLWPILVRTISFFLIGSSLEEFPCTLASALHCLEALFAIDDTELTTALQSYQRVDSSKKGPFRAIQLVSIFIFVVHSLTESPDKDDSTGKGDKKHSELTPLGFAAVFICMGRLTERCLKGNQKDTCPLLPAVLVFLEWLGGALAIAESHLADERIMNALSYFFCALADLLNRIDQNWNEISPDCTALWEDHELRGFYPLISVHEKLDFTKNSECSVNFICRDHCRLQRILHAARRIMETSENSREWISYDKVGRVFNFVERSNYVGEAEIAEEIETFSGKKIQPTIEEEEVILFKPITRRNSAPPAPLYMSKAKADPVCSEESLDIEKSPPDEWLRRATSLSTSQTTSDNDSFTFSTTSNSGHNRLLSKDLTTHPTGPPSLSAWVLSKENSIIEREKGLNDFNIRKLSPIDEIASTSFYDLSINETKDAEVAVGHTSTVIHNSSSHFTPIPSAPLLPDDAAWLRENSLMLPEYSGSIGNETDGILGAAPISGYMARPTIGPGLSSLVDGYPPFVGMSSSEWLYHYRNSQNMANSHISPVHFNAPPAFGNFHMNELSSYDVYDQWGNHLVSSPMQYLSPPQLYPHTALVYGGEEQKRDKMFIGYQRAFPYICGVGMEVSSEQPPLLQYLKEKERQLQPGSQLRGPFMGN